MQDNPKYPSDYIVLLVDDEPLLRMIAAELVEDAGLEYMEAANADEAFQILKARNDIIILFTDIDMPGSMDGLQLAAAVHDRWPPVALIVVSGHKRPSPEALPEGALFLAKPYAHDEVIRAFRSIAARPH